MVSPGADSSSDSRRAKEAGASMICDRCKARYPLAPNRWLCDCGGPLSPVLDRFRKTAIVKSDRSIWRYRDVLPKDAAADPVTLGEGGTPMELVSIVGMPVNVKLEFVQPTGCHKDRGSSVLASALKAAEAKSAVEDSSGNAGASLAAYLARANISLQLFVPAGTPKTKMRQAAAHGARMDDSARGRSRAERLAQEAAQGASVYASHVYSPYFLAGQMTLAWEIWEDLGYDVPRNIVVPVGHGMLLLGLHRGFKMLKRARLAKRVPRFFGVQSRACAPLYEAYMRGGKDPSQVAARRTSAVGVRIARPPRGREVLAAVNESGGAMLNVSDAEIRRGQALAANLGWYVEPSSAVALAGLVKLDKQVDSSESMVLPLTGSGLKA